MNFLFSSLCLVLLFAPGFAKANATNLISISDKISCRIDGGIRCWANNPGPKETWLEAPALGFDPVYLSAGSNHVCAANNQQVKCWGNADYPVSEIPQGKNISMLVSGGGHSCFLDDEGVKCWGSNQYSQSRVPQLNHPTWIAAGVDISCAVDGDKVKCWGNIPYNSWASDWSHQKFSHPREVSIGDRVLCVTDSDGVQCFLLWSGSQGELENPSMKNPISVSVSYEALEGACAIDEGKVLCWGPRSWDSRYGYSNNTPDFKHPSVVKIGGRFACAVDDEGTKCWELWRRDERDPRTQFPEAAVISASPKFPYFHPNQVSSYLRDIGSKASPARSQFLEKLSQLCDQGQSGLDFSDTNYLVMAVAAPAILSADSVFYTGQVIPGFQASVLTWNAFRGYNNFVDGLEKIPYSAETGIVSLRSLEVALQVFSDFIPLQERSSVQDALRILGQAEKNPLDVNLIRELISRVEALTSSIQKYSTSRNAFLFPVLKMGIDWLRKTQ
jgi:hypothetical protein